MTDFLVASLGNTSAALAAVGPNGLGAVLRVPLDRLEALGDGFAQAAPGDGRPVPVVVASVHPAALERFGRLTANLAQKLPEVAGVDFPIPVRADVDEPKRVGVDRLLAALAARETAGAPCVVVDAGTAITVDAVGPDGAFLGGAILPGPAIAAQALADGTAQLPHVALPEAAPQAIGRSTEAAIAAGCVRGTAGAIEALAAAVRERLGAGAPLVLTGGHAARLMPLLSSNPHHVPELVLEGLVLAYRAWLDR